MNGEMAQAPESYLSHPRGLRSWLFTLDHKRIGVMYLIAVMSAFLVGGVFALLMRTSLLSGDKPIAIHGAMILQMVLLGFHIVGEQPAWLRTLRAARQAVSSIAWLNF